MRLKLRVVPPFYVNLFSLLSPTVHKIRGDSLCAVDLEGLKSLGIVTIGQRLSILKSIYHVKLAQNMTFSEDDYIPPCSSDIVTHKFSYLKRRSFQPKLRSE